MNYIVSERSFMQPSMITHGNWNVFLTLTDEHLLLVKRKHPLVVLLPIVFITCLTLFFIGCSYFIFYNFFNSSSLFFISTLLLISLAITLTTKTIIDWYFHMYILTNRKILELRYTPLTSYIVNDIMLDRVNCTEINLQTHGFLNEIIDMGNILITFDRPTHEEEFVFRDVQGSHQLVTFLTQQLLDGKRQENIQYQPIWFKRHHATST